MRVVFMGTPSFAVPSLQALSEAHEVVGVYTRPDRRSGRGRQVTDSPVKARARALGLDVLQPERFDQSTLDTLVSLDPDVICVAAYGVILPRAALEAAAHGAVNVHASLLPVHRGAAPVERAILAGDRTTGVSIMLMEETLDTGPVARSVSIPVGEHTSQTLTDALAVVGAAALTETLREIEAGSVAWVPQDDTRATYAAKVTKADVRLDPGLERDEALRRVRASSTRSPCRAQLCGAAAVIVTAAPTPGHIGAGSVSTSDGLVLGLSDGDLRVERLKPASRGEMTGSGFVCGLHGESAPVWTAAE